MDGSGGGPPEGRDPPGDSCRATPPVIEPLKTSGQPPGAPARANLHLLHPAAPPSLPPRPGGPLTPSRDRNREGRGRRSPLRSPHGARPPLRPCCRPLTCRPPPGRRHRSRPSAAAPLPAAPLQPPSSSHWRRRPAARAPIGGGGGKGAGAAAARLPLGGWGEEGRRPAGSLVGRAVSHAVMGVRGRDGDVGGCGEPPP